MCFFKPTQITTYLSPECKLSMVCLCVRPPPAPRGLSRLPSGLLRDETVFQTHTRAFAEHSDCEGAHAYEIKSLWVAGCSEGRASRNQTARSRVLPTQTAGRCGNVSRGQMCTAWDRGRAGRNLRAQPKRCHKPNRGRNDTDLHMHRPPPTPKAGGIH